MTHELVGKPQAALVQDGVLPEDHRVVQGTAPCQPVPLERFDLVQEAKGPGPRDPLVKDLLCDLLVESLGGDQGMVEIYPETHPHTLRGFDRYGPSILLYGEGLHHLQVPARRVLSGEPGLVQEPEEWSRASIHGRHLGPVYEHKGVVHAGAPEGGHEMFNRGHRHLSDADGAGEATVHCILRLGGDEILRAEVLTYETDSRIGRRRGDLHGNYPSCVKPDPGRPYLLFDRMLHPGEHDMHISLSFRIERLAQVVSLTYTRRIPGFG